MLETHEQSAEIVPVLIDAVIALLYFRQLQEAQYLLLQLAAPFSRNDLQHVDSSIDAELHRLLQSTIDLVTLVEDVMQIDLMLRHGSGVARFAAHSPVYSGLRFSRNAFTPSL